MLVRSDEQYSLGNFRKMENNIDIDNEVHLYYLSNYEKNI